MFFCTYYITYGMMYICFSRLAFVLMHTYLANTQEYSIPVWISSINTHLKLLYLGLIICYLFYSKPIPISVFCFVLFVFVVVLFFVFVCFVLFFVFCLFFGLFLNIYWILDCNVLQIKKKKYVLLPLFFSYVLLNMQELTSNCGKYQLVHQRTCVKF